MQEIKSHQYKKWEVSIITLVSQTGTRFKVTRRLAEMSVAETKIFDNKEEAINQFEVWLRE